MTTSPIQSKTNEPVARAAYQAAVASALLAGVFCLFVAGMLAAAHVRTRTLELQNSEDLASLRAAMLKAATPAAAERAKEALRTRDLELREEFFRRQAFTATGGYLILGGIIVFVIAAGRVVAYRKRLPMPHVDPDALRKAARSARLARAAVAVLGVAIAGSVVVLAILSAGGPTVEAPQAPATTIDFPSPEEIARQWPRFRGPGGAGVSAYTNVPTTWSAKTGENILWKTALPLPGENSPVVWGDRIFLAGAHERKREVYCLDATTGKLLWQKAVETPEGAAAAEPPDVLEDTGYAAPTAATDGRRVAAIFANADIACFDFQGKQLWARNFGPLKNAYGYSSSLDMYRGMVIVLLDQGTPGKTDSSLLALDAATGKTVWEAKRPVPNSWASPIIFTGAKGDQLVAAAKPWVISYDPATGTERWRAKVLDGDVAPSPVFGGGFVLAVNTGSKLAAIRPDGHGDVTATHVAWGAEDGLPDIVSPVTDGKYVWLMTTDGLLSCYAVRDGKPVYDKELDEAVKSSPTLVGDRLYICDTKGVTRIIGTGGEYKEISKAELGEPIHASPAFLDGRIYIRTTKHLFAIGKK